MYEALTSIGDTVLALAQWVDKYQAWPTHGRDFVIDRKWQLQQKDIKCQAEEDSSAYKRDNTDSTDASRLRCNYYEAGKQMPCPCDVPDC